MELEVMFTVLEQLEFLTEQGARWKVCPTESPKIEITWDGPLCDEVRLIPMDAEGREWTITWRSWDCAAPVQKEVTVPLEGLAGCLQLAASLRQRHAQDRSGVYNG